MLTSLSAKNRNVSKFSTSIINKESKTNKIQFSLLTPFIKIIDEKNQPIEVVLVDHTSYGLHAVVCDVENSYQFISLNNICSGHNTNLNGRELLNSVISLPISNWTIVYNSENKNILIFPKMHAAGREMEVTTAGLKSAEFSHEDTAKLTQMDALYNKLGQFFIFTTVKNEDGTKVQKFVPAPASVTQLVLAA